MLPEGEVRGLDASEVDANVLAALPDVEQVLNIAKHGQGSAWAQSFRIDVRHTDGKEEGYFMKVSVDFHGREALKGEFTSTQAIHSIVPQFCPKPIAWGTFATDADAHFYLCKFYDFRGNGNDHMPDPEDFCRHLATLHKTSESPTGKFGFECVTYNGNLPQDNTWHDSWEAFFANGLRHILNVREERAGPHPPELVALLPPLFDVVIPRLLRPLESDGRVLKPSLVHGDLWCGNVSVLEEDEEESLIYDPASFWAHNEYELGNWRPERNRFNESYFEAYHSHIERSEPLGDYDDRNALYALRFDLHAAALFPDVDTYLPLVIDAIKVLTDKFAPDYGTKAKI